MDDQTTTSWLECPSCEGSEGWMDGDTWVDCPHCEGSGGWPE